MVKIKSIALVALIGITLTTTLHAQPALKYPTSYDYVKSNMEFLASDELEGRETTTRGAKIASLFISRELEKYGIKPYGDEGTYFQNFKMSVKGFAKESYIQFSDGSGSKEKFTNGNNIIFYPQGFPDEKFNSVNFNIIFAGHGITSEDDDYDDYKNIDAEGKVILVASGSPKKEGVNLLNEEKSNRFSRSEYKKINAMEHGAVGIIFLPSERTANYWDRFAEWATSPTFNLAEEDTISDAAGLIPSVYLNLDASNYLLENEKYSYQDLINPENKSFSLKKTVIFKIEKFAEIRDARNVIGIIEGNDEKLKDQFVTLGAHYDHLGISGNKVNNGADDNASGTVTLMEVGRNLALHNENKRSVIITFYTGEEKGLKGSKYLADHNNFFDQTVVNINIDMVGRQSEDSIYCIGSGKLSTELFSLVKDVNSETANFVLDYKFDDPGDPNRFYYRSDHVHYAKRGIPIVFFYDYMMTDYHKPSDTFEKINYNKIVKMTRLINQLSLKIANLDHKLIVDKLSSNIN